MRRTKEEAQETRSAILDAAERVFFERGVSQTTLSQIAAEANMTRGAIYWHFSGKSNLFRAMQERACLPQEEFFHAQNILDDPEPLEALHRTVFESLRRFAGDERAKKVYSILLLRCEYVGEMEEAMLCHREAENHMHQTVVKVFERALETGRLSKGWDAETASNACVCVFTGLFTEWLRSREAFDLVRTGTLAMDGLFAAFRAEIAPTRSTAFPALAAG